MGGQGSGRRPRSSHLKAIEGVRADRLALNAPEPTEGVIVPPVKLEPDAHEVWNRIAPLLIERRVLSTWDVDIFSMWCRSVALFNRAADQVEREGTSTDRPYKGQVASPAFRVMVAAAKMVTSIGAKFGLTPADRATINVAPAINKSLAEKYLT
jgi:P27 family predicted phage terminase small subunit